MLRTLVFQVDEVQAEALKCLLISGDGKHGDPSRAWGELGAVMARKHGRMLLDQLRGERLRAYDPTDP